MNVCRTLGMALVLTMAGWGTAAAESRVALGYLYQSLDSEEAGSDREGDLHGLELRIFEQQQTGWFGEFLARGVVGDSDFMGAGSDEEAWAVEYRLGRRLSDYVGLYSGLGYRQWESDQDSPAGEITRDHAYSPVGIDIQAGGAEAGWRLYGEYGVIWSGDAKSDVADKSDQDDGHFIQVGGEIWLTLQERGARLALSPYWRRWDVDASDNGGVPGFDADTFGLGLSMLF